MTALADGNYELAATVFGELAQGHRSKPLMRGVATYNHGLALLRAGDAAQTTN